MSDSPFSSTSFSPLSTPGLDSGDSTRRDPPGVGVRAPRSRGTHSFPPPRGLHIPKGEIRNVRFGGAVPHNRGRTYAQRAGLRYEQKVHDVLGAIYEGRYRKSTSILYEDRTGLHRAIPDGVLVLDRVWVALEIKFSHTERAWWQLMRVYVPLLRGLAPPGTTVVPCEVCSTYDPEVRLPGPHVLTESLHSLSEGWRMGVIHWKL